MKKKEFTSFLMMGASTLPLRKGVDLLTELPQILEDAAQAVEYSVEHSPGRMTFAAKLAWIVENVKKESHRKKEHYQEILDLFPENSVAPSCDALKNMVSRERSRQQKSLRS